MPKLTLDSAPETPVGGDARGRQPHGVITRRLMASAAALLGAGAVLIAVATLVNSQFTLTVQPNRLLSGQGVSAIITANNSPTVVRNPNDANSLVIVNRVDRPQYSTALHWTLDGGRTWGTTSLPLPPGRNRPYAPDAVFVPDGTLYVLYVNLEGIGNDPQTLWLSHSSDAGRSLSPPVAVTSQQYMFQARIAVDATGSLYITWLHADAVGTLTIDGPVKVLLSRSVDHGRTFSPPVTLSDPQRFRVGAPTPVVDSQGAVDVLYEDFGGDVRDFLDLQGPPWQGRFTLVLARSTNRGRTFAPGVVVDQDLVPTQRFLVYLPVFPAIAVGPSDRLYVAWADGRSGVDQVFLRVSTDAGATWDAPQLVSGVLARGQSAWLPQLSVAPNGRVDVLYLAGQRDLGNGLINAYLASSNNNADSFVITRVSTQPFDSRIGPLTGPAYLAPDLGSRMGLSSSDATTLAAWTDTKLGTVDTGRQDIVAASVDASATGFPAAQIALTLVLLGVAAALIASLLLMRRRERA